MVEKVSALAILQARMSSSRLPGKVMMELNGLPMIYWQINRILKSELVKNLVVATSTDSSDDILVNFLRDHNFNVFRGSLSDVHSRFLQIINSNTSVNTFVRLTADCPLVMPDLLTDMLRIFNSGKYDYYTNCINPTYPDGLDIEIFSRESFLQMSRSDLSDREREHVTLKFRTKSKDFRVGEKHHTFDLSSMRWTVDYKEDFQFVKSVYESFLGHESTFTLQDVLNLLQSHPELNNLLPGTLRHIALQEIDDGRDFI
jgi:spore coat polysaccharide biosynthesis protein SpsF (cytidylyltransferase family)